MSALSEFLLARIAEDAEWCGRCDCWNGPGWTGAAPGPHVAQCPVRIATESAAKREIVELCAESDSYTAEEVLHKMAEVHSGHPDYRPRGQWPEDIAAREAAERYWADWHKRHPLIKSRHGWRLKP